MPIFLHLELGACASLRERTVWLTMVFAQAERFRTLAPSLRRACAELARAGLLTNYVILGFRSFKTVDKGFRTTLI